MCFVVMDRKYSGFPALAALALFFVACGTVDDSLGVAVNDQLSHSSPNWFEDEAQNTGLDFVHISGMTGHFYQPEISGAGAGLFDFDNDGDLDIIMIQGAVLGTNLAASKTTTAAITDRLYRNDLKIQSDGSRVLRFTDVTDKSGLVTRGFGQGLATGDFNNDGWVDLYLPGFERNQLFRNNGDGTFTDVSRVSGTDSPSTWGVSATFVDIDRDGWLDLFVGNYLNYSLERHVRCFKESGQEDYCAPGQYTPQQDVLYLNRGDGTFVDITAAAGMAEEFGPALGVVAADMNGDGEIDLFVANDQQENQLWINQGDRTFENVALMSGVAIDAAGVVKADMGVDAGDFDNDGDEDLFTTVLTGEGSTIYVNDGTGLFDDHSAASGIRAASLPYTGWGTAWMDFDNDGWLDLLSVNGLVWKNLDAMTDVNPFPYHQRNQLLRNNGNGRFTDVTPDAGEVFDLVEVSRGAAFGDLDNDGDVDVLIANSGGPAQLLINYVGNQNHWLGLRLVKNDVPRDLVGARVEIIRSDGSSLWRRSRADGSYASANDPRVLVGLGTLSDVPRIRVVWPSGVTEEWNDVAIDQYSTLIEGDGRRQ